LSLVFYVIKLKVHFNFANFAVLNRTNKITPLGSTKTRR
jgi:hypothetical protein